MKLTRFFNVRATFRLWLWVLLPPLIGLVVVSLIAGRNPLLEVVPVQIVVALAVAGLRLPRRWLGIGFTGLVAVVLAYMLMTWVLSQYAFASGSGFPGAAQLARQLLGVDGVAVEAPVIGNCPPGRRTFAWTSLLGRSSRSITSGASPMSVST